MKRYFLVLWLGLLLSAVPVLAQTGSVSVSLTASTTDCTVANSCAVLNIGQNVGGAVLTLTGTWSATVQFEARGADSKTWVAISATPSSSTTTVTSATANGTWQINVAGYSAVRIRCSAFTSGTINASVSSSTASARAGGGGGTGGAVSSVFTRTGDVVATTGDYTCAQVTNCSSISGLTATYLPIATDATHIGNSVIHDDGAGDLLFGTNGSVNRIPIFYGPAFYVEDGSGFIAFSIATDTSALFGVPVYFNLGLRSGLSSNNDLSGTLTASAGSVSYTFIGTYASHPVCVASDETATASLGGVKVTYTSTTSVTFTTTGMSDVIDYICAGRN